MLYFISFVYSIVVLLLIIEMYSMDLIKCDVSSPIDKFYTQCFKILFATFLMVVIVAPLITLISAFVSVILFFVIAFMLVVEAFDNIDIPRKF